MRRSRPDSEWAFGPPPLDNDNFAWLEHGIDSVAPGGKVAMLMPNQAATSTQEQEHEIRRQMVEQGAIQAVIALPPRMFSSTSIGAELWVLGRPVSPPSPVLFVDAMTTREPGVQELASPVVYQIGDLFHARMELAIGELKEIGGSGLAVLADIDSIRRANYSLNPLDYTLTSAGDGWEASPANAGSLFGALATQRARLHEAETQIEDLRVRLRPGSADAPRSGWHQLPLHELCDIQAGPSCTRLGSDIRTPNGSVPVVMPRHLRDRRIAAVDASKVTSEVARELANFRLAVNDIVCVRAGSMGDPALVEQQQAGWLFGTNLLRLRITEPEIVTPHFLLGVLSSRATRDWVRNKSRKTAIPSISTKSLGELPVTLPPLGDQDAIGSALSALDEQLAAHQGCLRAAVDMRNELTNQLVAGALRLP
jgi:type I restriction enzyme M protein